MSEMMDSFENQFVNMEVQAEFMENTMAGSTSLSTPEGDVNHLMQQILLSNSANSNRKRLLRSRNDPSSTFLRLSL
ncbi:unnamed protein product [Brassica oleracea var. botrytis]|uniref:(rape) hypothetical protein n=1 Tax=Brassica napus TaxID=3708 RepID=A0A816U8R9_BRANA|nr:unnamed protein product [Brassica napus]